MYNNDFERMTQKRFAKLRTALKQSSREMSNQLGQSKNYCYNIENGHAIPLLSVLFYMCNMAGITPRDFLTRKTKIRP